MEVHANLVSDVTISKWKILLIYCIVSFFLIFEMAIQVSPSVMSTQLMHDLNIGAFGLGLMSGIYFYTYAGMQIPTGLLFDRYNPRIIITLSILICTLGTLIFSFANNIYIGAIARLLMGSGSAFAFVAVLVVSADLFKSTYFATMTGITQMLGAMGAILGQMPVSTLVNTIGWRETLLIISAIGIVLSIIVWTLLKYEKHQPTRNVNRSSNISLSLKQIITQPQTWYLAAYSCLLWAPMSSFASLWGIPYLTTVNHFNPTTAAFLCSLMWFGLAIGSPILGIISTLLNNRVLPLIVTSSMGITAFGLLLHFNFSQTAVGILLFFAGIACTGQTLCFTLAKDNNHSAVRGTAIAFNNMAVVVSGALFQPIIGKVIEIGHQNTIAYDANNYKNGVYIIFAAYILAFITALFFIKESDEEKPNAKITLAPNLNSVMSGAFSKR